MASELLVRQDGPTRKFSLSEANFMASFATANTFNFSRSISSSISRKSNAPSIPIFVSTESSAIDLSRLSSLYSACNQSFNCFPDASAPADLRKLGVAIANSAVVVSVFTRDFNDGGEADGMLGRIWSPLSPENGRLVGFGRAVSDLGLTASIHDVMVVPDSRRIGIGRLIVERIVRTLANKGVYDISALCSEQESFFFKACGFGDDTLGSTTMMYVATGSRNSGNDLVVKAGRKL